MDCKELTYEDDFFDVVIDKSTIDALLCGDEPDLSVAKMMKEIQRVLRLGGIYWAISYGNPEHRLEHLKREHLSFDIEVVTMECEDPKAGTHYSYICKKNPDATLAENSWNKVKTQLLLDEEKETLIAKSLKTKEEEIQFKIPQISSDEEDNVRNEEFDEDVNPISKMNTEEIFGILRGIQEEFEEIEAIHKVEEKKKKK